MHGVMVDPRIEDLLFDIRDQPVTADHRNYRIDVL